MAMPGQAPVSWARLQVFVHKQDQHVTPSLFMNSASTCMTLGIPGGRGGVGVTVTGGRGGVGVTVTGGGMAGTSATCK